MTTLLSVVLIHLLIIGLDTTSTEINVIENIFKLKDLQQNNNQHKNLIDQLDLY